MCCEHRQHREQNNRSRARSEESTRGHSEQSPRSIEGSGQGSTGRTLHREEATEHNDDDNQHHNPWCHHLLASDISERLERDANAM